MRIRVKQQLILLLAVVLIMAIGITGAIIVPSVRTILSLEKDIFETQKYMEQQYQRTQRLRRSVIAVDDIKASTSKFLDAFVREGDELKIITQLESLAAEFGIDQALVVDYVTEEPDGAKKRKLGPPYYTFSFLNHGTFADHVQYLRALERLPYYFVIDALQWEKRTRNPNESSTVTLRFDARLHITRE